MRPIQRWYWERMLKPKLVANEPVRDIILKCRQTGFSTFFEAFLFWRTLGNKGWNSVVIASKEDQSKLIFRMIRRFDRNLKRKSVDTMDELPHFPKAVDTKGQIEYRLTDKAASKRWKDRNDYVDLDSRIEVLASTDETNLGRAGTYQCAHCSEVAFWADLSGSLSTLLSCIPESGGTSVFLETTGNGMNQFYSLWTNGALSEREKDVGAISWRTIFVPWYWDSRYEVSQAVVQRNYDKRLLKARSPYEEWLYDRIQNDKTLQEIEQLSGSNIDASRTWAKILWRRFTLKSRFFVEDDKDEEALSRFKQEFPATEAEAFLFTGRSVFSAGTIQRLEQSVRSPIWTGEVEFGRVADLATSKLRTEGDFVEKPYGSLRVWQWPEKGASYVIFADVAEGRGLPGETAIKKRKVHADYSCAQIIKISDYPPMIQVAVWHGNIDPDMFGDLLVVLSKKWNNAFLGWEINGPGASISVQVLQKNGYRNIYLREDFDIYTSSITKRPGWRTTKRTKPVMISALVHYARSGTLHVLDTHTVTEMKSYSQVGEGKYEAGEGNDDRVVALAGAVKIAEPYLDVVLAKRKRKEQEERAKAEGSLYDANQKEVEQWMHPILGSEW